MGDGQREGSMRCCVMRASAWLGSFVSASTQNIPHVSRGKGRFRCVTLALAPRVLS
jgi:hypothetical protein